ncbi:MAG: DAK2 domain-containing protein [Dehalococcoidia bacterium]
MSNITSCDGRDLRGMFSAATRLLERNAQSINTLNVFPVPDGDTGTNMLLTIRAAIEEASRCPDGSAAAVAQAMAKGSLMGARGNSGVILSQIFRGLAEGLDGKHSFNGNDLAAALVESSTLAYKGMSKPVEGTILTVIREVADAAQTGSVSYNGDLLSIMEVIVDEARASVARTPTLLSVLRQAGVVDAGGQGLYVVLEGALRYLRGEQEEAEIAPVEAAASISQGLAEDARYGYCTEFLLQGKDLNLDAVRGKLITIGESVLVVGDESTVRVHLHTFDPGAALSYGASLGTLQQVKVENMDEQHRDFIVAQPQSSAAAISTIAVASGEGLTEAFYSIGAAIVIPGGETMNPSVQELLQAVESAPSDKVIMLPNNPNILLAAGQVLALTQKKVEVVPTKTIPQGVAALLALNHEEDLEANVAAMKKALSTVRSGEVTTAVRSMELDSLSVKKGQAIAFLDGRLVIADGNMPQVVLDLLAMMDVEGGGLVTIYYGADTESAEAEQVAESVQRKYPSQEVEVVAGGQPYYNYIVSVE